ncbi:transposable element Tcb2 transposase [Trichonephila clavipes]|nr:transposable element Tcb2 transposase [Trichonephila clavipes]
MGWNTALGNRIAVSSQTVIGFMGGRTDLHIIRNGTLTGRRYAYRDIRPHVIPYAGAIGDSFVFQDDNARPHRARLVENMLEAETIQRMECALLTFEHVWDMFGRRTTKAACYCPRLGFDDETVFPKV